MPDDTPSFEHIECQPLVGVDENGCEHRFDQYRDTVYVLRAANDELAHVETLQPGQLPEWIEYVADVRGWAECRYVPDGGFAMLAKWLIKQMEK